MRLVALDHRADPRLRSELVTLDSHDVVRSRVGPQVPLGLAVSRSEYDRLDALALAPTNYRQIRSGITRHVCGPNPETWPLPTSGSATKHLRSLAILAHVLDLSPGGSVPQSHGHGYPCCAASQSSWHGPIPPHTLHNLYGCGHRAASPIPEHAVHSDDSDPRTHIRGPHLHRLVKIST